jgi:nucleoside-diphosphate-sugar epimerase
MLSTLHAMHVNRSAQSTGTAITVAPVTQETWRAVYALQVTAAQRAFGYRPAVTVDEGLRRLEEWLGRGAE